MARFLTRVYEAAFFAFGLFLGVLALMVLFCVRLVSKEASGRLRTKITVLADTRQKVDNDGVDNTL